MNKTDVRSGSSNIVPESTEELRTRKKHAFCQEDEYWLLPALSGNQSFNFSTLSGLCTDTMLENLKAALKDRLAGRKNSSTRADFYEFYNFADFIKATTGKPLSQITSTELHLYKSTFDPEKERKLGGLRGFLRQWHRADIAGVDKSAIKLMSTWRIGRVPIGEATAIADPQAGAFTLTELQSILTFIDKGYKEQWLSVRNYVLMTFQVALGVRPVQLVALKIKDLLVRRSEQVVTYLLHIPIAKQRYAELRDSFAKIRLLPELGAMLESWTLMVQREYARKFKNGDIANGELPIFPWWKEKTPIAGYKYHMRAKHVEGLFDYHFQRHPIMSQRTSPDPLHIMPIRFRRTCGTRLALKGFNEQIISVALTQRTTSATEAYIEAAENMVEVLDEATAMQIAPLAQAFQGAIIDESQAQEWEAVRRKPIAMTRKKCYGWCGHDRACPFRVPVGCYECPHFFAHPHGPHLEVLRKLIQISTRISGPYVENPLPGKYNPRGEGLNRTILAVALCARKCESMKAAIADSGTKQLPR